MLKSCGWVVGGGGWPTGFYCQPQSPLGFIWVLFGFYLDFIWVLFGLDLVWIGPGGIGDEGD